LGLCFGRQEILQRDPADIRWGTRDQVGSAILKLLDLAWHRPAVPWRTIYHHRTNLEMISRF
jgi:hypothetical protein